MITVSERALIKLENELNQVKFRNLPIGGVIANAVYIELFIGNADWSFKSKLKDNLLRFYLLFGKNILSFFNKKKNPSNFDKYDNQCLITFSSSRRHIFKIGYSIWKKLNEKRAICLIENEEVKKQFSEFDNPFVITKSDLPSIDFLEWRNSFSEVEADFKEILKKFININKLPRYVSTRIFNYLISQSQALTIYEVFLKTTKLKYILVEYDRFHVTSPLVLAARLANVPTFSMVHGVVNNRFGYLPILANQLFCWGNGQKETLLKYATDTESQTRIRISGAPQLSSELKYDKYALRRKLRIPDGQNVVLLATNAVEVQFRHQLIQIFCKAVEKCFDIKGIVRIHPSEEATFYADYIDIYPNILFDNNKLFSYEESFCLGDLFCIFNSAYAIDAILKHLPVVIINVNTDNLGQAADLIETGKLPSVKSEDELEREFQSFFYNSDYRRSIIKNVETYAKHYCYTTGDDAASLTLDGIQNYLKNTVK